MSRRRQVRAYLAESRPEAERWSAAVQCLLRGVTVTADTGKCASRILTILLRKLTQMIQVSQGCIVVTLMILLKGPRPFKKFEYKGSEHKMLKYKNMVINNNF